MFSVVGSEDGEVRDPHTIHEKILVNAKKSGVLALNNRGLLYGNCCIIYTFRSRFIIRYYPNIGFIY